ncbi:hypothetical protein EIP91_008159 [Steccherinum ochraceum]|uniref:G-patch domain-containing protein n=1 Tax=Steccherinum ochraceum TaxID=92696 RepID=A0A4R0R8Y2_9APHY|nr:hypothetical protein EIP91_008159 [Steccherinum ochraceum]
MATIARYIYSHYDPPTKPRNPDVQETPNDSRLDNEEPDPWQTESTFGAQKRLGRAPRFVPAIISYDEINDMIGSPAEAQQRISTKEEKNQDVSAWYRSLTRGTITPASAADGSGTSTTLSSRPQTPLDVLALVPSTSTSRPRPTVTKNDWFIRKALQDQPSSTSATPPPTLADILEREPPAATKEQALRPPVFLALGPSNRGYTMLERSGWSEGEALGPYAVRKQRPAQGVEGGSERRKRARSEDRKLVVEEMQQEVAYGSDGDVSEVRKVEVVDLTLSDSDVEEDAEIKPETSDEQPEQQRSHDGKALLTPIPTILKADRLGIGLKAKTVGPYRVSKKRVTHNQAALAAHTQSTEEMKRMKKIMGRGTRAFARAAKADSEQRRQLLASLNDP